MAATQCHIFKIYIHYSFSFANYPCLSQLLVCHIMHFCRVPEVLFDRGDVWMKINDEELLEIRRLIIVFLLSTVVQRVTHAILEVRY